MAQLQLVPIGEKRVLVPLDVLNALQEKEQLEKALSSIDQLPLTVRAPRKSVITKESYRVFLEDRLEQLVETEEELTPFTPRMVSNARIIRRDAIIEQLLDVIHDYESKSSHEEKPVKKNENVASNKFYHGPITLSKEKETGYAMDSGVKQVITKLSDVMNVDKSEVITLLVVRRLIGDEASESLIGKRYPAFLDSLSVAIDGLDDDVNTTSDEATEVPEDLESHELRDDDVDVDDFEVLDEDDGFDPSAIPDELPEDIPEDEDLEESEDLP